MILTIPRGMSAPSLPPWPAFCSVRGPVRCTPAVAHRGDLEGFSSAAAAAEMQLEQRFDSDLSARTCAPGWNR